MRTKLIKILQNPDPLKLWEYHRKFELEVKIAEMKISFYEQQKIISGRTNATDEEREKAHAEIVRLKNEMFKLQTHNKRILEQKPKF